VRRAELSRTTARLCALANLRIAAKSFSVEPYRRSNSSCERTGTGDADACSMSLAFGRGFRGRNRTVTSTRSSFGAAPMTVALGSAFLPLPRMAMVLVVGIIVLL
jgi:hypothetical protein